MAFIHSSIELLISLLIYLFIYFTHVELQSQLGVIMTSIKSLDGQIASLSSSIDYDNKTDIRMIDMIERNKIKIEKLNDDMIDAQREKNMTEVYIYPHVLFLSFF
jgi:hypothetical protein